MHRSIDTAKHKPRVNDPSQGGHHLRFDAPLLRAFYRQRRPHEGVHHKVGILGQKAIGKVSGQLPIGRNIHQTDARCSDKPRRVIGEFGAIPTLSEFIAMGGWLGAHQIVATHHFVAQRFCIIRPTCRISRRRMGSQYNSRAYTSGGGYAQQNHNTENWITH